MAGPWPRRLKRDFAGKTTVTVERRRPVVLYVVPACSRCAAARQQLAKRQIPFVERNVAGDFGALRAMYEATRQRLVPVVDDRGTIYVLPDEADIERIARGGSETD